MIPKHTSNIDSSKANFVKTFKSAETKKPQQNSGIAAAFAKTTIKTSSPDNQNETSPPKDQEKVRC